MSDARELIDEANAECERFYDGRISAGRFAQFWMNAWPPLAAALAERVPREPTELNQKLQAIGALTVRYFAEWPTEANDYWHRLRKMCKEVDEMPYDAASAQGEKM